jgi:hypothetical protein
MIFDPEEVGCMVRKIIVEEMRLEEEQTDDFQDIELWRVLVVRTAGELIKKYGRHLIVPMTLYKTENFDYIINGFRNIDEETYHFCLVASEETIFNRLMARGDKEGGWSHQRIDRCVSAFKDERFHEHI